MISKKKQRCWWVYVLRLEGDYYYIGISRDVDKRFQRHLSGKGARFTQKHKPIEIVERFSCDRATESEASLLEMEKVANYAMRYGTDKVSGGGYSWQFYSGCFHSVER